MFKKLKESFGDKFIDNCALVFTHWQNSESKIDEIRNYKREQIFYTFIFFVRFFFEYIRSHKITINLNLRQVNVESRRHIG